MIFKLGPLFWHRFKLHPNFPINTFSLLVLWNTFQEVLLHAEEDISLGPENQNNGSDEDEDDETVVVIDEEEDEEDGWNAFIYLWENIYKYKLLLYMVYILR